MVLPRASSSTDAACVKSEESLLVGGSHFEAANETPLPQPEAGQGVDSTAHSFVPKDSEEAPLNTFKSRVPSLSILTLSLRVLQMAVLSGVAVQLHMHTSSKSSQSRLHSQLCSKRLAPSRWRRGNVHFRGS